MLRVEGVSSASGSTAAATDRAATSLARSLRSGPPEQKCRRPESHGSAARKSPAVLGPRQSSNASTQRRRLRGLAGGGRSSGREAAASAISSASSKYSRGRAGSRRESRAVHDASRSVAGGVGRGGRAARGIGRGRRGGRCRGGRLRDRPGAPARDRDQNRHFRRARSQRHYVTPGLRAAGAQAGGSPLGGEQLLITRATRCVATGPVHPARRRRSAAAGALPLRRHRPSPRRGSSARRRRLAPVRRRASARLSARRSNWSSVMLQDGLNAGVRPVAASGRAALTPASRPPPPAAAGTFFLGGARR